MEPLAPASPSHPPPPPPPPPPAAPSRAAPPAAPAAPPPRPSTGPPMAPPSAPPPVRPSAAGTPFPQLFRAPNTESSINLQLHPLLPLLLRHLRLPPARRVLRLPSGHHLPVRPFPRFLAPPKTEASTILQLLLLLLLRPQAAAEVHFPVPLPFRNPRTDLFSHSFTAPSVPPPPPPPSGGSPRPPPPPPPPPPSGSTPSAPKNLLGEIAAGRSLKKVRPFPPLILSQSLADFFMGVFLETGRYDGCPGGGGGGGAGERGRRGRRLGCVVGECARQ